jgi:membrane-associated phospholipid phosphatase
LPLAACLAFWSGHAAAQAAPASERSGKYYALHGGIVGGLLGASAVVHFLGYPDSAGSDFDWFPGDKGLRGRRSAAAVNLSNEVIALTVAEPVFLQLGQGVDAHFANFGVVYAEALGANLLLNGLAKVAFRRPRPYSYGLPPKDDPDLLDRNVSFYSGHSSTAFVSAVSGGLIFAESAPNQASRCVVWGTQLALAGATANLRVVAGKHYYSDVVVGALIGSGLGIALPVLHGARYAPKPSEYAAGGGGLLAGLLVTSLLPLKSDVPKQAGVEWTVLPSLASGGVGLAADGRF